uniref:translation initiation factor IF-2-like isoform X2 n=1 Tax=Nyctereutes procyonoides TaxID=34880 RepID=UPI00244406F5|nr:translation initiation factor IF-2-like isoform X2 [Nyctereutes procyonoides]
MHKGALMKAFGWWMSCALVHTCALSPHTHPHTGGGARGCRSSSAAAAPRGPPWQWGITARPGSAPPPAGPHPGGGRLPPTHFARKLNCVSSSSEMRWEVLRSPRTARLSETVHCGPTPGPSFPRPAEILKHFQPDPGRGGPVSEPQDSRFAEGGGQPYSTRNSFSHQELLEAGGPTLNSDSITGHM